MKGVIIALTLLQLSLGNQIIQGPLLQTPYFPQSITIDGSSLRTAEQNDNSSPLAGRFLKFLPALSMSLNKEEILTDAESK